MPKKSICSTTTTSQKTLQNHDVITRHSLGGRAKLGELYNIYCDQYWGELLFGKKIPPDAIKLFENHKTTRDIFMKNDDLNEKFNQLGVEPEMRISLLAGLLEDVRGHGDYCRLHPSSASPISHEASVTFIFKMNTKYETLLVNNAIHAVPNQIAASSFSRFTHVIVGVEWGLIACLTLTHKIDDHFDESLIKSLLKAKLNPLLASNDKRINCDDNSMPQLPDIKFKIFIDDEFMKAYEIPKTVDEGIELMRKLPNLVANVNEGKGTAINYRLLPLSACKQYLCPVTAIQRVFNAVDEQLIYEIVEVFDEMQQCHNELSCILEDVKKKNFNSYQIAETEMKRIKKLLNDTDYFLHHSNIMDLQGIVLDIRKGKKDNQELRNFLETVKKLDYSPLAVRTYINEILLKLK